MNYDLAKELKDAGFPQSGEWGISHQEGTGILLKHSTLTQLPEVYCPTLSELIAACGEDFKTLVKCKCEYCKWNCHGSIQGPHQPPYDDDNWARGFNGTTPEEAVARLWLALNPKKV